MKQIWIVGVDQSILIGVNPDSCMSPCGASGMKHHCICIDGSNMDWVSIHLFELEVIHFHSVHDDVIRGSVGYTYLIA